jgi:hypothetical protein
MKPVIIKASLIAPCGINCALCYAYRRQKNNCPGCRFLTPDKLKSRNNCIIANCTNFAGNKKKFCFNCSIFSCKKLKQLDKRYRTRYGLSVLENLQAIKSGGIRKFVKSERNKWACINCGSLICMHKKDCLACGNAREIKPL